MVTKYIPRKPKPTVPQEIMVLLYKDYPLRTQIKIAAEALKNTCPEIFKKDDPYPTVRMVKFKEGEILYEIAQGSSRAKTGPV